MPVSPWKSRPKLLILFIFGVLLLLVIFGGSYNVFSLWNLYQQKKALSLEVEKLRVENQILADQIRSLKEDPEAIEKVARENIGMAGKGETVYRILPEGRDSVRDSLKSGK
jgi:cell division protein FtsB